MLAVRIPLFIKAVIHHTVRHLGHSIVIDESDSGYSSFSIGGAFQRDRFDDLTGQYHTKVVNLRGFALEQATV